MNGKAPIIKEKLVDIVNRFAGKRILVIGDAIADQFVYGGISRVSREAPVFIIRHEHTETLPGGAANCAINLSSLGAKVSIVGVAGDDEAGKALLQKLNDAQVNCDGLIISREVQTTRKARILAGQSHSTRQQVIRIDYEDEKSVPHESRQRMLDATRAMGQDQDAIIISDYNYGVLGPDLTDLIREIAGANKIPVLVDSRFSLLSFPGFTSATPNEVEVEQLLGVQTNSADQLASAGEQMRERLGYHALLITRGGQGMVLLEKGAQELRLEAIGSHEPVDVTGAGDTVIATYTLALASDASFQDAARLANYAGGLVVMKRGTASVTADELRHSIEQT